MVRFDLLRLAYRSVVCAALLSSPRLTLGDDRPPPPVDVLHTDLRVRLTMDDIRSRRLPGTIAFRFRVQPAAGESGLASLTLDSAGPKVERVALRGKGAHDEDGGGAAGEAADDAPEAGRALEHRTDDAGLTITLDRAYKPGEELGIAVWFVSKPKEEALYFVLPDDDHPERGIAVYTMSEPMRARCWTPCIDRPTVRSPFDVHVTAPPPLSAVSVGVQVGEPRPDGDLRTFHWRLERPVDPHLLGLAVGEFVTLREEWRGRPVLSFVQPGDEEAGRFTFRLVPKMLEYYTTLTGVDFPFPQYSHVAVEEHYHGGMEHAGFSMIAPSMLTTGPRGHVPEDVAQFNYIAHMLAHEWFAGMVSYGDVRHAWLNEGFGTYLHLNWQGQLEGPDGVADLLWRTNQGVAGGDPPGGAQPIVRESLLRPGEVFQFGGGRVYWKGAMVLHMLRHQLGEETFWRGVRLYLTRNDGRGVLTDALRAALEEASGRDLRAFFDQWVFRAGTPRFTIEYAWDAEAKKATLALRQRGEEDSDASPFAFPLDVWLRVGEAWQKQTLEVREAEQKFAIDAASEPTQVCFDPLGGLLARRTERKPQELWRRQIREGPTALARSQAVDQARNARDAEALPRLLEALRDDGEFVGVRRRAATALSRLQDDEILPALVATAGASATPPSLRVALIGALEKHAESDAARRAVLALAEDSQPIEVQEEALSALSRMRPETLSAEALGKIARWATPPQSRHVRGAALRLLLARQASHAIPVLVEKSAADERDPVSWRKRLIDAVSALAAENGPHKQAVQRFLVGQLADRRPGVQLAALRALQKHGDADAAGAVRPLVESKSADVAAAANSTLEAIAAR